MFLRTVCEYGDRQQILYLSHSNISSNDLANIARITRLVFERVEKHSGEKTGNYGMQLFLLFPHNGF